MDWLKKMLSISFETNLYSFGADLNPEDSRDVHVASYRPTIDESQLPAEKITDISMIEVQDQGFLGSCVGQAVGSEIEYRVYKALGRLVQKLSRRFIYAMCKMVDGILSEGTNPRLAYKIACSQGDTTADLVPNDNSLSHEEYIAVPRSQIILKEALKYVLPGFAIFDAELGQIKQRIVESDVFTATLRVYRPSWRNGLLGPVVGTSNEYHRILVYGYQNVGNDTRIFFRNSWGTSWGNNGDGYFWWSEYKNHTYDLMLFDKVPSSLLERVKNAKYIFKSRSIKYGDKGEEVLQLQKRLQDEGYYPKGWDLLTGFFGNTTRGCLLQYQLDKEIDTKAELMKLNGQTAGPKTIAELNSSVQKTGSLQSAIIKVESNGNDNAIGDHDLNHKAYGPMQIRQPAVDDVNKGYGTRYKAQDMLGNRTLSLWVFDAYMSLYATPARLGRPATDQDKARIWNGGPNGWRDPATVGYWVKVKALI